MANPFFQKENIGRYANNPNFQDLRNAYSVFSKSRNPMEVFTNMAMQNPQLQPVLNLIRSGGNPQQIFMNMCKERGINPQEFLNTFLGK